MNLPLNNRVALLAAVALILLGILMSRWIAGWGLVTIHVKDAPLGKVIASISRQAHVEVETSLDPTKPVTLDVDRVPIAEALDSLSIRAECSWRLVYLAAPTKSDLNAALISIRGTGKVDDWTTSYYPMPFEAGSPDGGVVDPRYLSLNLEGPDQSLPFILNQAAQKSGVMTALPKDWSPSLSKLPKSNSVHKTIPSLISSSHGKSEEFFLLTDRGWRGGPPGEQAPSSTQPPPQPPDNPVWIEQRQLAQITQLPAEKQVEAKKDIDDRKALFAEMRNLPPEKRMAKMKAIMSNPDMMDKMADRMMMRDSKMSEQQRITRAVSYLNHKASQTAAASAPAR